MRKLVGLLFISFFILNLTGPYEAGASDDLMKKIQKDTPQESLGLMDTKGVKAAKPPIKVIKRPMVDPAEQKILTFKYSEGKTPDCPKGYYSHLATPNDPILKKLNLKSNEGCVICYKCPAGTSIRPDTRKCAADCPPGFEKDFSDRCWKCPPGFEQGVYKGKETCVKTK